MRLMHSVVLIALLLSSALLAQSKNEGKTGLSFLKVGVGARASGMGEAFTAVADDAYATYWNPAGLLAAGRSNVALMHNAWLQDVNSEFAAIQFRQKKSSWALHVHSFNVGDIEVRTVPSETALEKTSAHYISAGISYARPLGSALDAGVTVKYLLEKIFVYSANGFGVDVGLRYRGLSPHFLLAAALQNIGRMNKFNQESTRLPKILRVGAQYRLPREIGPLSVLLAGDLVKPFDENLRFHGGLEGGFSGQLMLRAGYVAGYESRSISVGVGIRKSFVHFDYSFTPLQDDLGDAHRFSIYLAL